MAQNKGANVRYRAIDKCLSAKHGRYSWEDLQRACEDALYRAFSERISVSRRQIFNDALKTANAPTTPTRIRTSR